MRQAAQAKSQLAAKEKMDALMVAGAAATVGLVAGGLGDGAFAGGDAPWAPPVGAAALGGLGYAAATTVSVQMGDPGGRGGAGADIVGDAVCTM